MNGRVIMYADRMTDSMRLAIGETERRRLVQEAYNVEHGITPASIIKAIDEGLTNLYDRDYSVPDVTEDVEEPLSQDQLESRIEGLQAQMKHAAANLDFERAASLRDRIKVLKGRELGVEAERGSRS